MSLRHLTRIDELCTERLRRPFTRALLLPLLIVAFPASSAFAITPEPDPRLADAPPIRPITTKDGPISFSYSSEDDLPWGVYGRDAGGTRFSPDHEITPGNVSHLKVAWTYHTGDSTPPKMTGGFEATPICIDDTLFLSTPYSKVIALDAETGTLRWAADPHINRDIQEATYTSRGVAVWRDKSSKAVGLSKFRIFFGTFDGRLIALDASTGHSIDSFGSGGQVSLRAGLGKMLPWEYFITSPPTVVGDTVITGSGIADNQRADAPHGLVRGFDARTGKELWTWDPILRDPADPAGATPSADITGSANAWTVMSVDEARDMVFLSTGSAANDYYGGTRPGDNLYADCVVALKASTGKLIWHFQTVHHDIWDYDVPAEPLLFDFHRGTENIPAVAVATKMGNLFILDRLTGKPLIPVTEMPVSKSNVPGESTSATQPFPPAAYRLSSQTFDDSMAWGLTDKERQDALNRISKLDHGSVFTPPSLQGTVVFPGLLGGMNWSGLTYDPGRNLIFTTNSNQAYVSTLVPRDKSDTIAADFPDLFENSEMAGTPYRIVNQWLQTPGGAPMVKPPWGTLLAINPVTGEKTWETPIGSLPALKGNPHVAEWGAPVRGGVCATASGLIFSAGTSDGIFRAVDAAGGKTLWTAKLPGQGNATPMTFTSHRSQKQFVVICAGQPGDSVVAYSLGK